MQPAEFPIELKHSLLVNLFPHGAQCPFCPCAMNLRGNHALLCMSGGDRTRWHNRLRNAFAHVCEVAGLEPDVEPEHLLLPDPDHPGQDNRRPADVFLPL